MNRYTYTNNIQYKKYCIKELLKIKKENILNKIEYSFKILKDLYKFKQEISGYIDIDIKLNDYMPKFYSNEIFNFIKYGEDDYKYCSIKILKNLLFYLNKFINVFNKKINDLYYKLI